MSDLSMPEEIRSWMDEQGWGIHHLRWHTERRWDRLPASARIWAERQGWRRAEPQEGAAGSGREFLLMHRAMIQMLKERFPAHAPLFEGWSTPPVNPADPADPLPGGASTPFDPAMVRAIARLHERPGSFADDDAIGLFIETNLRPTPEAPFGTSDDPEAGIHDYLHSRFTDPSSPVNLGDPMVNLGNVRFWRLHGWIDGRWSASRQARGLADDEPALREALVAARETMHDHAGQMASVRGLAEAAADLAAVPATLRSPHTETVAAAFHRLTSTTPVIGDLDDLENYLQVAIKLELFTLPLYLTALWSLRKADANKPFQAILRHVAFEEMLHLGLVCNLTVAIGRTPVINGPVAVGPQTVGLPAYPDYPPGLVATRPFALERFSKEQNDRFLEIEHPEGEPKEPDIIRGLARAGHAPEKFKTIGAFYDAIDAGLETLKGQIFWRTAGQRGEDQFGDDPLNVPDEKLFRIRSIDDAHRAVKLIKEQGEGTTRSEGAEDFGGELAHYYQFLQVKLQRAYKKLDNGKWVIDETDPSTALPLPTEDRVYPMAPVPKEGYAASGDFDAVYFEMLDTLQKAWTTPGDDEGDQVLADAEVLMDRLGSLARTLMDRRINPDDPGSPTMAPDFLRRAASVAATAPPANPPA